MKVCGIRRCRLLWNQWRKRRAWAGGNVEKKQQEGAQFRAFADRHSRRSTSLQEPRGGSHRPDKAGLPLGGAGPGAPETPFGLQGQPHSLLAPLSHVSCSSVSLSRVSLSAGVVFHYLLEVRRLCACGVACSCSCPNLRQHQRVATEVRVTGLADDTDTHFDLIFNTRQLWIIRFLSLMNKKYMTS